MRLSCGLALAASTLSACTAARVPSGAASAMTPRATEDAQRAIRAVLDAQVGDWNAGDIRGFMDGYWRSDSLRFASGGTVRRGWQATLDGYVRGYPDRAAMGTLDFSGLTVEVLSPSAATVFGRWRLTFATGAAPAGGLFTLGVRRIGGDWRIVSDHTSSDSR